MIEDGTDIFNRLRTLIDTFEELQTADLTRIVFDRAQANVDAHFIAIRAQALEEKMYQLNPWHVNKGPAWPHDS